LIPDATIDRPKWGFFSPTRMWLTGELKDRLKNDVMSSPLIRDSGWFNVNHVRWLLDLPPGHDDPAIAWGFWNLALWHRTWFE
jgi:hypothetical protein